MPCQTSWQHAIEDIHPAPHPIDQVFGCTYSHQVAWFVFGKQRRDHIQHGMHLFFGFAHGESTNSNAGCIQRSNETGGVCAQICLDATLYDPEYSLIAACLRLEGTLCPAMRALHGEFGVDMVVRV